VLWQPVAVAAVRRSSASRLANPAGTPVDQARPAATPPWQRHVPGELANQVTLGGDRELVHQLVGNPDRRTGGRGHGQGVPDADRQLPGLSGACRGELDPRRRLRGVASPPWPGGQRGVRAAARCRHRSSAGRRAGYSVEVLMCVYARCVTGLEDVWIGRMNEALHLGEDR
jgi:hypothetical protein